MAYLLYKHIKKRRAHKAVQDSVTTTASETPAPTLPEPGSNDLAVVRGSAEPSPSLTVGGDANGQLGQAEKGSNDVADPYNSPAAKRARTVYRWKLIGGLFFPFTVAALDTTMVAGALPFIASDFRESLALNSDSCRVFGALLMSCRSVSSARLDRAIVQSHLGGFHSCVGPVRRFLWSICLNPAVYHLHAHR